jgi:integrase/recombinase XerD
MKNKRQEYKQLINFLEEKRRITELENITQFDLSAYIRQKQKQGLQPQSIVSMYKMISAFFNWCVKEEYLKENPIAKVPIPKIPKKIVEGLTPEEVQKMIDAFSFKTYIEARNKAIIAMLSDLGLRAMELRNLQTKDVKDVSILVNGKGNKQRIVFISPALKRILIKYERLKREFFKEKAHTDHYFLSYKGTGLSHVALDNVIKEAAERAGIKKRVHPHLFRHFYSVQSLEKIDVYSLSRLLGHSDISTTQRYLQSLNQDQLSQKAIFSSPLMNLNNK